MIHLSKRKTCPNERGHLNLSVIPGGARMDSSVERNLLAYLAGEANARFRIKRAQNLDQTRQVSDHHISSSK
jgi:hypothetical protein